jgi:hypothetical protein
MTISHAILAKHASQSYILDMYSVNKVDCLVTVLDGVQIVAVRGTEAEYIDIFRDLTAFPWYYKHLGMCHTGFATGAIDLVNRKLSKILDTSLPIIVTGHSAGAIIGLMVCKLLTAKYYNVIEWVGFGCPRGFFGTRSFSHPITSYKYGNDVVPTLLPAQVLGFIHPIKLTKIGKSSSRWPNASDHRMDNYLKTITSL